MYTLDFYNVLNPNKHEVKRLSKIVQNKRVNYDKYKSHKKYKRSYRTIRKKSNRGGY